MQQHTRGPALAFLALRVVDHVQQIRGLALDALLDRANVSESQVCLPVLHSVSRRRHGLHALDAYGRTLLDRHGVSAAIQLLDNPDLPTRRAAYAICLERDALSLDEVWERLASETDQFSKLVLTEHFVRNAPPAQVRDKLLAGKYIEGRLQSLYLLADHDLSHEDITERLLDSSSRVREAAQWRARRAGLSPETFYLDAWSTRDQSPARTHVLLEGLRQTGQTVDLTSLRQCLTSDQPRVRLAALKLWPDDKLDKDLFLTTITDTSPKVVRAAADALSRATNIRYGDVVDAASSSQPWTRRAAWRIRHDLGPWDRVLSDLELQADLEPDLERLAKSDLHEWLNRDAPTAYVPPTKAQRSAIKAAIEGVHIDDALRRQIAFHAGVSPPAVVKSPRAPGPTRRIRLYRLRRALRLIR